MILYRTGVLGGGIAETFDGEFTPITAREFVKTTEWTESFFLLEDGAGNKIPLEYFDNNGQMTFESAVYFDDTLETAQKINLLESCESELANNYLQDICRECGKAACLGDYTHFE